MKCRKLKLKKNVLIVLKIFLTVIIFILILTFIYNKKINTFVKLGYSRISSKQIIKLGKNDYVLSVGKNKMLNAAFSSPFYKDKYVDNYSKIKYQNQKDIIKNTNILLDKGYSNDDISIILNHGNNADVSEFVKKERIKYLEEFYQFPYAKLENYDRYVSYADSTGEDEKTTVVHVNLNMDKEKYVDYEKIDGFSYDMLVNNYHYMDPSIIPDDLIDIPKKYTGGEEYKANRVAVNSLIKMFENAKLNGLEMEVNSAYRSYDDQIEIAEFYRKWYGDNYVANYVARPGFSEHQTGLAFDVGSISTRKFVNSDEYKWMLENSYKYGFILRFPKKGESLTGVKNEPWHFRYVGSDIARYIHEHSITFEEYYVMFLNK